MTTINYTTLVADAAHLAVSWTLPVVGDVGQALEVWQWPFLMASRTSGNLAWQGSVDGSLWQDLSGTGFIFDFALRPRFIRPIAINSGGGFTGQLLASRQLAPIPELIPVFYNAANAQQVLAAGAVVAVPPTEPVDVSAYVPAEAKFVWLLLEAAVASAVVGHVSGNTFTLVDAAAQAATQVAKMPVVGQEIYYGTTGAGGTLNIYVLGYE